MANYVTIDSLKYDLTGRAYKRTVEKSQSVQVGLTGKTLSQDFNFSDQLYKVKIYVYRTESRSGYGALADLEASYADDYVTFIDQLGNSQSVFFDGPLNVPYGYNLLSDDLPVEIELSFRKRQV
jgi:hypothetical protein